MIQVAKIIGTGIVTTGLIGTAGRGGLSLLFFLPIFGLGLIGGAGSLDTSITSITTEEAEYNARMVFLAALGTLAVGIFRFASTLTFGEDVLNDLPLDDMLVYYEEIMDPADITEAGWNWGPDPEFLYFHAHNVNLLNDLTSALSGEGNWNSNLILAMRDLEGNSNAVIQMLNNNIERLTNLSISGVLDSASDEFLQETRHRVGILAERRDMLREIVRLVEHFHDNTEATQEFYQWFGLGDLEETLRTLVSSYHEFDDAIYEILNKLNS